MSSVLERAIAQFKNRPTHSVDVPEWAEPPKTSFTVYFRTPTLSVLSKAQAESGGDPIKNAAILVAQCALDENGERLFSNMAWHDLFREADPVVVQRINAAIQSHLNFNTAAVEAAEKN